MWNVLNSRRYCSLKNQPWRPSSTCTAHARCSKTETAVIVRLTNVELTQPQKGLPKKSTDSGVLRVWQNVISFAHPYLNPGVLTIPFFEWLKHARGQMSFKKGYAKYIRTWIRACKRYDSVTYLLHTRISAFFREGFFSVCASVRESDLIGGIIWQPNCDRTWIRPHRRNYTGNTKGFTVRESDLRGEIWNDY